MSFRERIRAIFRLPRGWRDALVQFGLLAVIDLTYELVRGLSAGKTSTAFANGRAVVELEQKLGSFFEPQFQAALLSEGWLIDVSNWFYMNCQFTVTAAAVFYLYLYRNDSYYFVRNMFIVGMGIALVVHALIPVAPPRLLTEYGFVDTVSRFSGVNQDSGAVKALINSYAAVPSMHTAFALYIAVPLFMVVKSVWAKIFWVLYPLMVLFSIVVTANHFWFDAATGAFVAVCSAASAFALGRIRPHPWAFKVPSQAPAAAPEQANA